MRGDGFNGSYYFAQLHFHWGENRSMGSEHTIDNMGYDFESALNIIAKLTNAYER